MDRYREPGLTESSRKAAPASTVPTKALIAGIAANLALAVTKFAAFLFTGSSAMLAESLHSAADSSNQLLLALGARRAQRPPTPEHPLGFGRERYFWAFVVAIIIFALGAAFSIYEGIHKLANPGELKNLGWSYGALGIGLLMEGFALRVAWKEFQHLRGEKNGGLLATLSRTKDPTLPTLLAEDSAAITGLLVALAGVTLSVWTGSSKWDAGASIVIGCVLLYVAWFLAKESHSLLIGESASEEDRTRIQDVLDADPDVDCTLELITLHVGPNTLLVLLNVDFRENLSTQDIEDAVRRIEVAIKERVPAAGRIFIEASSLVSPCE